MDKSQLLKSIEDSHSALLAKFGDLDDEQMIKIQVVDDWTPKDILAHVTRWENVCSGYLESLIEDGHIPPLDLPTDEWNARALAEDRALSLDDVWKNSDESYLRVRAMIESLEDGMLDRTMKGPWLDIQDVLPLHKIIAIDTSEHYAMHIRDIDQQAHLPKQTGKQAR